MPTHEVTNQVPPLRGYDVVGSDPVLVEALARWGSTADAADLHALGHLAGTERAQRWGEQADRNPPRLVTHDPRGVRVDEVDFHPAWHELLTVAVGHGLTAEPWTRPAGSGAHLRRAVGFVAWSQVEAGHGCPVSMTYAAAPALARDPEQAARWSPLLASRTYDPGLRRAADKAGALAGMGMTEKQGGSDVRANTTRAVRAPGGPLPGATYRLTGHKWFTSAPMDDVFLVLAAVEPGSPSCFVVPRVLDDGTRNVFALQRLKDKLGNRSNASSEVELDGTWGALLGEEGRGVRAIIDMVGATRLDCVLGSAATMRQALVRAVHHARHRHAFGRSLVEQPAMTNVLADLALESEAATLLGLRLAHAVDEGETAFARLAVAVGKYWVCKRTPPMVAEALECLGGNGYVEENGVARLYREAPLNSVWEGSGTVNALDVVRALSREPASLEAVAKELTLSRGLDARFDAAVDDVLARAEATAAADPLAAQFGARRLVEDLALVLQAALVLRHSPAAVAEAFVASRLAPERGGRCFGTLAVDLAGRSREVVDRAFVG
ncbi:acyl-CoA dehydrogenase family protein [Lapillicoccus jejuensis]|uniref:Putative acyl-CoA dehydrogenase n=1 Tax=Lapillicoccus jejuensis TaxID=402171 RepID=A0A542E5C9_9MICO|nr:acyl-CoA dehydrogenase family protein [Lapillicoccus jejuensis]TQJ10542.1 putative acyl-CoA dehydrogenase [Lapillicoccus jejuensis]